MHCVVSQADKCFPFIEEIQDQLLWKKGISAFWLHYFCENAKIETTIGLLYRPNECLVYVRLLGSVQFRWVLQNEFDRVPILFTNLWMWGQATFNARRTWWARRHTFLIWKILPINVEDSKGRLCHATKQQITIHPLANSWLPNQVLRKTIMTICSLYYPRVELNNPNICHQ